MISITLSLPSQTSVSNFPIKSKRSIEWATDELITTNELIIKVKIVIAKAERILSYTKNYKEML